MTATTPTQSASPAPHDPAAAALERAVATSWKAPVAFGVFTVIALVLFVLLGREGSSTFGLSTGTDLIQLAPLVLPTAATGVAVTVVLAALTVVSAVLVRRSAKVPLWFTVVLAILFLVAFLTWASAGQTIPVPGLLVGTVALSVPLIFGALGGVLSERVGVVNVAIEGQLLAGAFVSAVVASLTGQPLIGLASAMVAGMLVSFVLAAFAIKYLVDQVIVGVVLNVLVTGLTSFLFSQVLSADPGRLNSPPRFDRIDIPILGQFPIIGPVLFRQTIIVYVMYVAVFLVWYCLFHRAGVSASARWASTRRPPTPWASRSPRPGSGTSPSRVPSRAWAARSSRSGPSARSTRR